MKKRLKPLKNWFEGGGPHGISLGRDVARALGLSPEKHETAQVRIFAGDEPAGSGAVNARNSGRLSDVDVLFEKLDVHPHAMVPLDVAVEQDARGKKLVFTIARPDPARRCWALFANPDTYRIDEAVIKLTEDTWVTAGRPMRPGDRVLLWKGKGRGAQRGIVALGEVVTEPTPMSDASNPYWVTAPSTSDVQPRVRVRYVVPPALPLWLAAHEEVLGQLSVSRAKGGTVFNVTDAQWAAVEALAGGWPVTSPPGPELIGKPYVNVGRLPASEPREPFDVDPDKLDRGNQAHAATQDALADFLRASGFEPRSPSDGDPEFDLAWEHGATLFVAEVKSTTVDNEEKQLRLGLGQVLRYRQALSARGRKVVAVLVPERKPADASWPVLCDSLRVVLAWPGMLDPVVRSGT